MAFKYLPTSQMKYTTQNELKTQPIYAQWESYVQTPLGHMCSPGRYRQLSWLQWPSEVPSQQIRKLTQTLFLFWCASCTTWGWQGDFP